MLYWSTILGACTMGETAADFLSHGPLGLGYARASLILGTLVALALVLEWRARWRNDRRAACVGSERGISARTPLRPPLDRQASER